MVSAIFETLGRVQDAEMQFAAQVRMTFEAKWGMLPAWIHRMYRDDCAT